MERKIAIDNTEWIWKKKPERIWWLTNCKHIAYKWIKNEKCSKFHKVERMFVLADCT
jgi:hypothetical protein